MMSNWISTLNEVAELTAVSQSESVSAVAGQANGLQAMDLIPKGLLTTGVGLLGVFLVLTLFFVTIKVMQGFKNKEEKE